MRLSGIEDGRWDMALDHLLSGAGVVELGEMITLRWWTTGVGGRPEVQVDIHSHGDPRLVPRRRAEREVREGLALLAAAAEAHPRLAALLDREPVERRYVYPYGKGSVEVGRVSDDGIVVWNLTLEGVEFGSD